MTPSDHYSDGKFHNLIRGDDPMTRDGVWSTAWDFLFDRRAVRVPLEPVPVIAPSPAMLNSSPASGLRVTWLGHSTALIDIDGKRVLTDPIWSDRASPFSFVGPKRFHEPPLPLEALPPIDAVVISHDHYDHLDRETIRALHPRVPLFVVPLKVGEHLRRWGVPAEKIRELDWWQEARIGDLRLVCTPARHFSGRSLTDRNSTLWSSWSLVGPRHRVFFSGDGGMSPSFAEIGERLGPFDVTLMEVGAYHPRWADIHSGPEQAVQAHRDLGGRLMMPIHWGTFDLALHSWTAPAERLLVAAVERSVRVAIPKAGTSVDPAAPPLAHRWWPELPWLTAEQQPVISPGLESEERVAVTGPSHPTELAGATR